jgi:Domain of unknown function (DUF4124)
MKTIKAVVCCITFLSIALHTHAEGNRIVKWVDKDGITHYGDKPPMPSDTKHSSVLNKDGVIVKKVEQTASNPEADKAAHEQSRKDAALFASYNSIEEIDIARDRNIKMDEFSLESLYQKRANLLEHHQKNNNLIADLNKQKRPVPPQLMQDKQQFINDISETDIQIASKKHDIEKTRARFEQDKIRYEELKPKVGALKDIKSKKRSIIELEQWRAEAQNRVEYYKREITLHKRSGAATPQHITDGLLASTNEVARADIEIADTKTMIKKNEHALSSEH